MLLLVFVLNICILSEFLLQSFPEKKNMYCAECNVLLHNVVENSEDIEFAYKMQII